MPDQNAACVPSASESRSDIIRRNPALRQEWAACTLPETSESVTVSVMEKDRVIVILRQHAPELRDAGVMHLRVFGSVARGDNSASSDVDLLADLDKSKRFTLVTLGGLESRLADLLGVKVDLSSPEWMRESIRNRVLEEAILVF